MKNANAADTNPDPTTDEVSKFDINTFTPYRIALAAQLVSERLARHYRKRFGLSTPDWRVMAHLAHSGGSSVRDIENQVAMEKSKVSRSVTRLESRGLVAKRTNPADKRLVKLSLTSRGRAMMSKLLPLADGFQQSIESELGGDFKIFEKTLQKLIEKFSEPAS